VPELVGDDEPDFPGLAACEQRVPEDDSSGLPQPGYVRVVLPRAPTGVRHQHVPHGYAGPIGQCPELSGQLPVGERFEAVEHRLEHYRRDEPDHEDQERGACRGDQRPPAGKKVDARNQGSEGERGQDDADPQPLQPVDRPSARGLRRETPPVLVDVAAPEGKRRVNE
jgi:hypothetical protein